MKVPTVTFTGTPRPASCAALSPLCHVEAMASERQAPTIAQARARMRQTAIDSPLRRRMIEDMAIRKLAPKTQHDYVQRVKDFAVFLGRSPDTAKSEDVRGFRLHLASS